MRGYLSPADFLPAVLGSCAFYCVGAHGPGSPRDKLNYSRIVRIRVVQPSVFPDFSEGLTGLHLMFVGTLSFHVAVGDGLLVYIPNDDYSECRCIAACEIVAVDEAERRVTLDIREANEVIYPPSRVRWRWRQDPYLCPDKKRARDYGLVGIFARSFDDPTWHDRELKDAARSVFEVDLTRPTLLPQIGEVYLFGSTSHGTKIGKSVDVEKRKKEVENDIGESLKILHRFSSNDYSRAEFTLHTKYSHLRRKGEWFDLTSHDIAEIQSISSMTF